MDVDFGIFPLNAISQILNNRIKDEIADAFRRDIHVLIDKIGLTDKLVALRSLKSKSSLPSKDQFLAVVNGFLYILVWVIKKIKRGELWSELECLNGRMQWQLLKIC